MNDAELLEAVRGGDRKAAAAMYDAYADKVHDYAYCVLRDRTEAAEVTADTFRIAFGRASKLREPAKLRSWLYAIARFEALRRAAAKGKMQLVDGGDAVGQKHQPDARLTQVATEKVVWDAAGGISETDRALLFLGVRGKLEGQELADAVGIEPSDSYALSGKLRDRVQSDISALLVARHGRRDCPELEALLKDWDGTFGSLINGKIGDHINGCDKCKATQKKVGSPLSMLTAMPLTLAPAALRDDIIGAFERISSETALKQAVSGLSWQPDPDGFPPPMDIEIQADRRPFLMLAGAAAFLLLLGGIVVLTVTGTAAELITGGGGDDIKHGALSDPTTSTEQARETTSTTRATTSTETTRRSTTTSDSSTTLPPPPTTNPTFVAVTPTGPPPTASTVPITTVLDRTGPAFTGTISTSGIISVNNGSACVDEDTGQPLTTGSSPTKVTVSIGNATDMPPSNSHGVASITLHWKLQNVTRHTSFTGSGSTWTATVGPIPADWLPGTKLGQPFLMTVDIEAKDSLGNSSTWSPGGGINVLDCVDPTPGF